MAEAGLRHCACSDQELWINLFLPNKGLPLDRSGMRRNFKRNSVKVKKYFKKKEAEKAFQTEIDP